MRWRGRRESSNIEDRRSGGSSSGNGSGRGGGFRLPGGMGRGQRGAPRGPMRRAGGGGIGTIIILGILFFALTRCGGMDMLTGGGSPGGTNVDGGIMPRNEQTTQINPAPRQNTPAGQGRTSSQNEIGQFVGVVLAETESVWKGIFEQEGQRYPEPQLVMFSNAIRSACGSATSASGPFYCPGDSKIYLDTSFFNQLERQFRAGGDFANAYVIAHEVGHHVQNVIGVLPRFNKLRRTMSQGETNQMSIRVELQADCFAGIWAHYTNRKGLLEEGDIEEALNAATQIGDDAIQKRTQGYVVPESFNHGTSKQRKAWFYHGFETGKLRSCDTKIFG